MLALLLLFVSVVFAAPIAQPTITSTAFEDVLSVPRYYGNPFGCVIAEKFLVIAGGYSSVYVRTIDIVDISTGTLVGQGNLSIARGSPGVARFGQNQCLVSGGYTNSPISYLGSVELITIDASTGAFVSVENITDFPTEMYTAEQVCVTLPDNNVFCGGGYDDQTVNTAAIWNGTTWFRTDFPVAWYAGVDGGSDNIGSCVLWGTDVWCCGGEFRVSGAPDFCQVLDTMTYTWSNFTVSPRYYGASSLVLFPTPKLVLYGGLNSTGGQFDVDVITFDGTTYTLTTYPAALGFSEYPTYFSSISTFAFQLGFYNEGDYQDGTLYTLNTFDAGVPVEYTRVGSSYQYDRNNGYYTAPYEGWGAVWQNRVFVCGGYGYDSSEYISTCNAWDFSCQGNASNGFDSWVQSSTYVGCDMVNCHKNYFGSSCSPCDCNGQGCVDGYSGNGTCICEPNYFGSNCASYSNCSGNGLVSDGVSGDGSCLCFDGYNGTNCESGLVTCLNGATWDRSSGTCTCASGFYGSTCSSACACGANGLCKDGNTGTGECVCAPGTYSVAGAANNCSQSCNCGAGGTCDDGNYGTGACFCAQGTYGANCLACPACEPIVESSDVIQIFRCDDGVQGTGECIRLYNSASLTSTVFGLIALCFAFLLL